MKTQNYCGICVRSKNPYGLNWQWEILYSVAEWKIIVTGRRLFICKSGRLPIPHEINVKQSQAIFIGLINIRMGIGCYQLHPLLKYNYCAGDCVTLSIESVFLHFLLKFIRCSRFPNTSSLSDDAIFVLPQVVRALLFCHSIIW